MVYCIIHTCTNCLIFYRDYYLFPLYCLFCFRTVLHLVIFCAILVFNLSNLVSAIILRLHEKYSRSIPWFYFYIRVAINDSLFVIGAISLSILIVNVTKNSSSSLVFRSKVCFLIVDFIYYSYNKILFLSCNLLLNVLSLVLPLILPLPVLL